MRALQAQSPQELEIKVKASKLSGNLHSEDPREISEPDKKWSLENAGLRAIVWTAPTLITFFFFLKMKLMQEHCSPRRAFC